MALTDVYVDPSIAASSGTGTIGDPYGDIQYALDTMTRDGTNGDRLNIKAGTDEILAAALTLVTYGTPTITAPLMFQGYTTAAGDGGIGGISGAATFGMFTSAYKYILIKDMHLHNSGAALLANMDDYCFFENVELNNTTNAGLALGNYSAVINSYFHNIGNDGCRPKAGNLVANCFFENGTNDFTKAIETNGFGTDIVGCVFDVDGATDCISFERDSCRSINNSFYSNAGTGTAITHVANIEMSVIINSVIEGFSGVGGIGIEALASTKIFLLGYNAFYNNTTNESLSGDVFADLGNDQSLGASPFTDAPNNDFTVSAAVKALGFPTANYPGLSVRTYLDIGALQRQEVGQTIFGMRRVPI